jgi:hypothetical protein
LARFMPVKDSAFRGRQYSGTALFTTEAQRHGEVRKTKLWRTRRLGRTRRGVLARAGGAAVPGTCD